MNNKNLKKETSVFCLLVIMLMVFIAAPSLTFGCSMGSAYSLTEIWLEQGDLHSYEHDVTPEPRIIANGVIENDYNTCGHEYFTTTTITLPDNTVVGSETDIIVDGIYFASTQLEYFCPITAREFDAGESSNELVIGGDNTIYYKYNREEIYNSYYKTCYFRACIDTDQNPSNGCWGPSYYEFLDRVPRSSPCGAGVRITYSIYTIPLVGYSFCARFGHYHIFTFDPCPNGTL